MMPPQNQSVADIAKETGLSEATLYKWQRQAREKGLVVPGGEVNSDRWSTQDKFQIVLETSTLSEVELAEYCREKGIYVEQVKAWKDACLQANGGVAQEAARLQKELKQKERENRELQKELNIKERALAETAALLVLRKKARAIWGDGEDA
jgi:transposase-like protein